MTQLKKEENIWKKVTPMLLLLFFNHHGGVGGWEAVIFISNQSAQS